MVHSTPTIIIVVYICFYYIIRKYLSSTQICLKDIYCYEPYDAKKLFKFNNKSLVANYNSFPGNNSNDPFFIFIFRKSEICGL